MMSSQTDTKHRSGGLRRLAAAALGAAALALVGASAASAETAYISNAKTSVVNTMNPAKLTEAAGEIPVAAPTSSIAVTPNGGKAYAPEFEGEKLIAINLGTKKEEGLITLGKKTEPEYVAVTPNGEYVYVADEEANKVTVVKVATKAIVAEINVGEEPEGIAFTSNGKFAYVADKATEHQGQVTVISNASEPEGEKAKVVKTINIGKAEGCKVEGKNPAGDCVEPEKIAISHKEGETAEFAYVADGAAGTVSVFEIKSKLSEEEVEKTLEVGNTEIGGTEPSNIAITPNGKTAYVTNGTANTVVPITIGSKPSADVVGSAITEVGLEPHGIAATNALVVVTDEENAEKEDVRKISTTTNTVTEKGTVAGIPDGVAIH